MKYSKQISTLQIHWSLWSCMPYLWVHLKNKSPCTSAWLRRWLTSLTTITDILEGTLIYKGALGQKVEKAQGLCGKNFPSVVLRVIRVIRKSDYPKNLPVGKFPDNPTVSQTFGVKTEDASHRGSLNIWRFSRRKV